MQINAIETHRIELGETLEDIEDDLGGKITDFGTIEEESYDINEEFNLHYFFKNCFMHRKTDY